MNSDEIKKRVMDTFVDGYRLVATDKGQDSSGPMFLNLPTIATMLCNGEFDDCEEVDFDGALYAKIAQALTMNYFSIPSEESELVQCEARLDVEPNPYIITFWLENDG